MASKQYSTNQLFIHNSNRLICRLCFEQRSIVNKLIIILEQTIFVGADDVEGPSYITGQLDTVVPAFLIIVYGCKDSTQQSYGPYTFNDVQLQCVHQKRYIDIHQSIIILFLVSSTSAGINICIAFQKHMLMYDRCCYTIIVCECTCVCEYQFGMFSMYICLARVTHDLYML